MKKPVSKASLAARLTALRKRHSDIDTKITDETARPAPDSSLVRMLKRRKLMIKDEMAYYDGVLRTLGQRMAHSQRGRTPDAV